MYGVSGARPALTQVAQQHIETMDAFAIGTYVEGVTDPLRSPLPEIWSPRAHAHAVLDGSTEFHAAVPTVAPGTGGGNPHRKEQRPITLAKQDAGRRHHPR